jgi:hypothetical protein
MAYGTEREIVGVTPEHHLSNSACHNNLNFRLRCSVCLK